MGRMSLLALLAACACSRALTVSGYSSAANDRFASGFPSSPLDNGSASFIGAGHDWSAVGWSSADATKGFALLTPRHTLVARHYGGATTVRFAGDAGIVSLSQASLANTNLGLIFNGLTYGDLSVGRLTGVAPDSAGLPRVAVFDGNTSSSVNSSMNGRSLIVHGRGANATSSPRIGAATVEGTSVGGASGDFLRTTLASVTYQTGDSGSPVFTGWTDANGVARLALMGNAAAVDATNGFNYINYLGAASVMAATNALTTVDGFALRIVGDISATWVGGSGTSLTNRGAWGLSAPSAAPTDKYVRFDGATAGNSRAVTVDSAANQRGIAFASTGSGSLGFTFGGGSTLTIGRGGVQNLDASRQTFGNALALGNHQWWHAGDGGITVTGALATAGFLLESGGGDLRIDGAVSGTGALSVSDGALTLAGANTHSGGTFVVGGHLRVGSASATGTGALTLLDGRLSSDGASARTLANAVTLSGDITLGAAGTGDLTLSGNVALGGATRVLTLEGATTLGGALSNGGIAKAGQGLLRLAGNSAYAGGTRVLEGTLAVDGSIVSAATVDAGATLGGRGSVGAIGGAGTVAPGNSPGILTAPSVDGAAGLDFAFEFGAVGDPRWSDAGASVNDVLRLTSGTPFLAPLGAGNRIDLYLGVARLTLGDSFRGGFFTDRDSSFLADIQGAELRVHLADSQGTSLHNGIAYRLYGGPLTLEIESVATLATFASGSEAGYVLQLTAIPEPSTYGLFLGIAALAAGIVRRRLPA